MYGREGEGETGKEGCLREKVGDDSKHDGGWWKVLRGSERDEDKMRGVEEDQEMGISVHSSGDIGHSYIPAPDLKLTKNTYGPETVDASVSRYTAAWWSIDGEDGDTNHPDKASTCRVMSLVSGSCCDWLISGLLIGVRMMRLRPIESRVLDGLKGMLWGKHSDLEGLNRVNEALRYLCRC